MKVSNGLDLQSQKIINMADPSTGTDAATKQYVDNVARGLYWKQPVRVATTTNGTLATAFAAGQVVDGVTLVTGDRILLKDQTTSADKGIYVVAASGAPTRAVDADTGTELNPGTAVTVTEGTTNGDKVYMLTSDTAVVIGTTSQTWGVLGGGNIYTGSNGILLTGANFTAVADPVAGGGIAVTSAGIKVDTAVVARKFSTNIGNGALTSIPVVHNLGTQDVTVAVREVSSQAGILCDWVATDANTVTLTFATAPASNAFRLRCTANATRRLCLNLDLWVQPTPTANRSFSYA
jgi:hypothetical protein